MYVALFHASRSGCASANYDIPLLGPLSTETMNTRLIKTPVLIEWDKDFTDDHNFDKL